MDPGDMGGVGLVVAARPVDANVGGGDANDDPAGAGAVEEGVRRSPMVSEGIEECARMDISPVKPPVVAMVHDDDMSEGDALSP